MKLKFQANNSKSEIFSIIRESLSKQYMLQFTKGFSANHKRF